MVRGNWQKRADKAVARRVSTKQRKQRSNDAALNKSLVQDLMTLLDNNNDRIVRQASSSVIKLWIWTDTCPSSRKEKGCNFVEDNEGGGNSHKQSRGRRSSSFDGGPAPKGKLHPNSKEAAPSPDALKEESVPLCRQLFFSGKCGNGKKDRKSGGGGGHKGMGGCPYEHTPKGTHTLFDIIGDVKVLRASSDAAGAAFQEGADNNIGDGGAMEMVYPLCVSLSPTDDNDNQNAEDGIQIQITSKISEVLSKNKCPLKSIVYLAMNNPKIVIFDRYSGGITLTEKQTQVLFHGNDGHRRNEDCTNGTSNHDNHILDSLMGPILEHILTFLPHKFTVRLLLVCKRWKTEIGTASPQLWKNMLTTNGWPDTIVTTKEHPHTCDSDLHRSMFICHHTAVRDVRAIQRSLKDMSTNNTQGPESTSLEFAVRCFASTIGSPEATNPCSSFKVWSDTRVVASYESDCTVRIFEGVGSSGSSSENTAPGIHCRQVLNVPMTPHANASASKYSLRSMDIDEDFVGCLVEEIRGSDLWLLVISRDDLLCAGGGGRADIEPSLQTFNLRECVVEYLLMLEGDPSLLRFFTFLGQGGDLSEIKLFCSTPLVACGKGRFMFLGHIMVDEEGAELATTLAEKLFIFSVSTASVIWMTDLNTRVDLSVTKISCHREAQRYSPTRIVALPANKQSILRLDADRGGIVSEMIHEGEVPANYECICITPSDIIVTVEHGTDGGVSENIETALHFYPHTENVTPSASIDDPITSMLGLGCIWSNLQMESIRDDYIVVTGTLAVPVIINNDAFEGHWWGDVGAVMERLGVYAVLIHVPTRTEIYRTRLDNIALVRDICIASHGHHLSLHVNGLGIVMTGDCIRDVRNTAIADDGDKKEHSAKKKKKNKRLASKTTGKKDGFARGMSLRG